MMHDIKHKILLSYLSQNYTLILNTFSFVPVWKDKLKDTDAVMYSAELIWSSLTLLAFKMKVAALYFQDTLKVFLCRASLFPLLQNLSRKPLNLQLSHTNRLKYHFQTYSFSAKQFF